MKKIAFAFCAALFAMGIQAATVTWTMTNVYGPSGELNNGIAYMIGYLTTATDAVSASAITDALQSAFANDDINGVNSLLAGKYSWTPSTAGTYSDSTKSIDPVADLGLTAGSTYNLYAVVFDTDTVTADSKFFVTKELSNKKVPTSSANLLLAFGTQETASKAEGVWTAVAVPEPTTVALLALGLAAVGLKRKVA